MKLPSPNEIIEEAYKKKKQESLLASGEAEANIRGFAQHLANIISREGIKEVYTFKTVKKGWLAERSPFEPTMDLLHWCGAHGYTLETTEQDGRDIAETIYTHKVTMPHKFGGLK